MDNTLDHTLVLTVRKSFWAAPECEIFPHRLYTRRLFPGPGRWGSNSRNPLNNLTVILGGLAYARQHKTRLIIIGSASRATGWFARFRRAGWLPQAKLLATTQSYFNDEQAKWVDRIIVYSRSEIDLHAPELRSRYIFMPLPADGRFDRVRRQDPGSYIFSGGGAGRDFSSLIEAVRPLGMPLEIVTFSPDSFGYFKTLPGFCRIHWTMPLAQFLDKMGGARLTVVPLKAASRPHGHTTIVQSLCLGKAVITTEKASIDDYVTDGRQGFVVPAGDVQAYRQAIQQLWSDDALRCRMEQASLERASEFSYAAFAGRLAALCREMVG